MTYWNNLSSRERLLIGIGLPLVLLIIFYLYFWQPYRDELQRLRRMVPEKAATLAWMQHRLAQQPVSDAVTSGSNAKGPLLTEIEKLAISTKVQEAIQRVQPGVDGEVEIWFQDVVADQLFRWIDQLSSSFISVESATITRSSPGLVSARVKLNR